MLFLGTETYPEEDGFASYLSENGGSSNAYTAAEDTCFYFDIALPLLSTTKTNIINLKRNAEPLLSVKKGALRQFASFFKEPLFTPSGAGREVNAVDSEHRKNLQQDSWRLGQLFKAVRANPKHPNAGFGTGSKDTLKGGDGFELQKALREHWARYSVFHHSSNACLRALCREAVDA
jgi:insulysin